MRLIRKIFNKILFASVVAIVFALFNRCKVKAYFYEPIVTSAYSTNGNVVSYSDPASELFTNVNYNANNWTYGGVNETPYWDQLKITELNGVYGNAYNFYVLKNKNNDNSISFGANLTNSNSISVSTKKPTSMFMYHLKQDGWKYVVIQSDGEQQSISVNMIIIYEDTPPILTNESNGNYSGNYRLTATSDTEILMFNQVFNSTSGGPYERYLHVELDSDEYLQLNSTNTKRPLQYLWWYGPSSIGEFYSYYAVEPISWNTREVYEDDFPSEQRLPSITFSPNYVKVNNLYVAVNVLVKVLDYNFTDYKYYYSFISEEEFEDYDDLVYTELFEQNFLPLDSEADTTLHFDSNGYLLMKIVDISNDEVVYATSLHISSLSTKEPDIDININYNSSNSTVVDEILIDTDYNIYSSNLTGYKCYYLFSNTEIEPTINDFTETDCSAGRLYVAHNNGYYYARITYNDEIVADVVRNISEYGQLVSTIYSDHSNNIFTKLLGGTNGYLSIFTNNDGPLYSLVSLPLRLGTFIYNFFNSSNYCSPYDFGTIFGQHFTIGCINLSILGSPLLQTIDTIFAGFFTITWGLFLYKLLRRMILLKDISITGLFKGGIF